MKLRSSAEVYEEFNKLCEEHNIGINGESIRKLSENKALELRLCKLNIEAGAMGCRERGEKDWLPWGVKSVAEFKRLIK